MCSSSPVYSAALWLWEVTLCGQRERHVSKLGRRKDLGVEKCLKYLENTVTHEPSSTYPCLDLVLPVKRNKKRFWGYGICNQKGRLMFGVELEYPEQGNINERPSGQCFQIHSCVSAGVLWWLFLNSEAITDTASYPKFLIWQQAL